MTARHARRAPSALHVLKFWPDVWLHAALARAGWTALAAALPLVTLVLDGARTPEYALSAIALAALASLATSLVSLPEASGAPVPAWKAVAARVVRTAGQVGAPVLAAAVLLQDVDWPALGVQVLGAVLITLARTGMVALIPSRSLPETPTTPAGGAA